MAYQASNNPRNSGFGSLYSDICVFAADITRERSVIAQRHQAESARKRQLHRQELLEAREHAAAVTLSSFKRSGDKVRRVHYFHQLGLLTPVEATIIIKAGSNSSDSHTLDSDDGSPISDDHPAQSAIVPGYKTQPTDSEDDNMPMLVDPSHEARFPAKFVRDLLRTIGLVERLTLLQIQDQPMSSASQSHDTPGQPPSETRDPGSCINILRDRDH